MQAIDWTGHNLEVNGRAIVEPYIKLPATLTAWFPAPNLDMPAITLPSALVLTDGDTALLQGRVDRSQFSKSSRQENHNNALPNVSNWEIESPLTCAFVASGSSPTCSVGMKGVVACGLQKSSQTIGQLGID
jgi:hypothetical protein